MNISVGQTFRCVSGCEWTVIRMSPADGVFRAAHSGGRKTSSIFKELNFFHTGECPGVERHNLIMREPTLDDLVEL